MGRSSFNDNEDGNINENDNINEDRNDNEDGNNTKDKNDTIEATQEVVRELPKSIQEYAAVEESNEIANSEISISTRSNPEADKSSKVHDSGLKKVSQDSNGLWFNDWATVEIVLRRMWDPASAKPGETVPVDILFDEDSCVTDESNRDQNPGNIKCVILAASLRFTFLH